MSTWVVGDLQGCLDPLMRLLDRIRFDPASDALWLVGDLVNRGPQSVETLRFVRGLGTSATVVLGNHDLALLAAAAIRPARPRKRETSYAVLDAHDADELLDWLRARSMLHVDGDHVMVHAGLLAQWSVPQAQGLANEVEAVLRGPQWCEFLCNMFGDIPDAWSDELTGWDRLRIIVNVMTRLRFLRADGSMDMREKGRPEDAPHHLRPWYEVKSPAWASHTILCGHWSTLGYRRLGRVIALDSGCVWGGSLTALRLEDGHVEQLECAMYQQPGAD